jgi:RNA polymerase sigma factor (sigma-70 family)
MITDTTPAADLLRSAVGRVGLATATDGELVRRYAAHRDDLAFAELVHRFAPAVYAVCRRHLSDPGAADDAFQAVFVLLARKAGGLIHPDRVGGWLFATADKVARTARRRQSKRGDRFRPLESVPEPASQPAPPSELRTVLDDELTKLPPHYRAVVLLCDVDGVSRRDAAARLNIPTGTLSNRLTRARAVLGRRLLRRGVLVAAGGVLSSGTMATPPTSLLASAVQVALADSPPLELLSLLVPVVPPMVRAKQLLLLGGLVLLGGAVGGVVLLMQKPPAPPTSEAEPPKPTQPVTPATMASKNLWGQWELAKPAMVKDTVSTAAFSPNGKWLVTLPAGFGKGSQIRVIETATWRDAAVIEWSTQKEIPHNTIVSDDGKRLFMQFGQPRALRVWDVGAQRFEERTFDVGDERLSANHLRLSPDGKTLAAYVFGSDGTKRIDRVRFWDAATGAVTETIDVPPFAFGSIAFTDDGKTVAGVCAGTTGVKTVSAVREWDVATGAEKRMLDLKVVADPDRGQVIGSKVVYTADGKQAVVSGGHWLPKKDGEQEYSAASGSVWVIDRESGKLAKTLIDRRRDLIREMHLTADGKKLIVQPLLTSRLDREFDYWGNPATADTEFVELQQWDVATWERDWVKIVPAAERWRLMSGAAK